MKEKEKKTKQPMHPGHKKFNLIIILMILFFVGLGIGLTVLDYYDVISVHNFV